MGSSVVLMSKVGGLVVSATCSRFAHGIPGRIVLKFIDGSRKEFSTGSSHPLVSDTLSHLLSCPSPRISEEVSEVLSGSYVTNDSGVWSRVDVAPSSVGSTVVGVVGKPRVYDTPMHDDEWLCFASSRVPDNILRHHLNSPWSECRWVRGGLMCMSENACLTERGDATAIAVRSLL